MVQRFNIIEIVEIDCILQILTIPLKQRAKTIEAEETCISETYKEAQASLYPLATAVPYM